MKYFTYLLFCLLSMLLFSCGDETKTTDPAETAANDTVPNGDFYFDTLKGLYMGEIGDSPLTLSITFASEKHATGYNMTKGNKRNISGLVSLNKETVDLILNEPGDHKYDGIFKLSMNISDPSTLTGEWESPSGEVKMVKLTRKKVRSGDQKDAFDAYDRSLSDTLGTIYLSIDGLAKYEWYENEGTATEQLKKIKGSWVFKNNVISVFWEANSVFQSRKSVFTVSEETVGNDEFSFKIYTISGEGRQLNEDSEGW